MADGGRPVLALYRRYRPDTFAQVVGQDHAVRPLQAALTKGRVNHAYLFSGPRGCGKTTSARVLARSLNCVEGPTPNPCGVCPSCRDLASGSSGSLDVIEIDAASHRGIDDARDLRDRVTFSPVRDRYKVVIIDEAHQITSEGFNALLKVVEEPPEHVVFVFATTEPEKVLGTIRSRTHHFPFRLVPPQRLIQHLESVCEQEGVGVDPAALSLVVRAGGGSVRDSMSVLDQLIAGASGDSVDLGLATSLLGYVPESLLDDVVDALAAVDGAAAFAAVHRAVEAGHDPRRYTTDLLERLRTLVVVSRVGDEAADVLPEVPEDAFGRLRVQASHFGPAELSRAADIVATSLGDMAGATSPRLLLELLVARLLIVGSSSDVDTSTRVERLERQLATLVDAGALPHRDPAAPDRGDRARPPAAPTRDLARPPTSTDAQDPASHPGRRGDAPAGVQDPPSGPGEVLATGHGSPLPGGPRESIPANAHDPRAGAPSPADVRDSGRGSADVHDHRSGAPAGMTVEVVRRTWDQVVDRIRTMRRATWALVSENAQVLALDETTLTLGFSTQGLADTLNSPGHSGYVHEALLDTLGLDRKVVAVAGGRASGSATDGPAPGDEELAVEPPPADDGWPEVAGAVPPRRGAGVDGSRGPAAGGATGAAAGARAGSAARRAGTADDAGEPAATPRRRLPEPEPEPARVDDTVSRDDRTLDAADGRAGQDVLERMLGAQVIEEQVTE